MNRIIDNQRTDNNPSNEGSQSNHGESNKEGFRRWIKRPKVVKDSQSCCLKFPQNRLLNLVQSNDAEGCERHIKIARYQTGELPEHYIETRPMWYSEPLEGQSSYWVQLQQQNSCEMLHSGCLDTAEGSLRIPKAVRFYQFGYNAAILQAYSSFDSQKPVESGERVSGEIQYPLRYLYSAPNLGQFESELGTVNVNYESRSWPGDAVAMTGQCWAGEVPMPYAGPDPDQGELVSTDVCESESGYRDECVQYHHQNPAALKQVSNHLEQLQSRQIDSRIATEQPCPLSCDRDHFNRLDIAEKSNRISSTSTIGQNQDDSADYDLSLETQLDDEDRSDVSGEIRSFLADMAIAASFNDLLIAISGVFPFTSGLRVRLTPSCLVHLTDPNDFFGFDYNLLYFDSCLVKPDPVVPIAHHPRQNLLYNGTRPFLPLNTVDQCQIGAVQQMTGLYVHPGEHIDSELSSINSSPVVDSPGPSIDSRQRIESGVRDSVKQCSLREQVLHDCQQPTLESLLLASDQTNQSPDTGPSAPPPTRSDPGPQVISPLKEGSETESDQEPVVASKAERPRRKRKLESSDSKPEATTSTRRSKKIVEHICELCGKQFARRFGLQMHWRTHSGERPYQCDTCQKRFAHQSHLNRHRRTHTGERNHFCFVCNRSFTENGSVIRHMKRRHPEVAIDIAHQRTRQM